MSIGPSSAIASDVFGFRVGMTPAFSKDGLMPLSQYRLLQLGDQKDVSVLDLVMEFMGTYSIAQEQAPTEEAIADGNLNKQLPGDEPAQTEETDENKK